MAEAAMKEAAAASEPSEPAAKAKAAKADKPQAQAASATSKKIKWRPWLRAIHRDIGYVAVGLTFIYALSGIAVNHITDWSDGDPSFKTYSRTIDVKSELGVKLEGEDAVIAESLRKRLGIREQPREIFRASPEQLDVIFDKRSLHVDTAKGTVVDEGQEPRFILRIANWLHLNRGKKAWTYAADAYAGALLFLATSGIFMIAGKKGLIGRGAVLVLVGILIPIVYVHFAGP